MPCVPCRWSVQCVEDQEGVVMVICSTRKRRSSVSSVDGYPTGRKGSKRRKSRTLPDPRHAERDSIVKNHKEMSSGVADLDTGVKILSFTHTEPIEVPSCKDREVKVSMRAQTPDATLVSIQGAVS
ncbi:uncharacterized protein LOC129265819 [Lytechinus pictus]|uniref:uncharacterized protein LOC129265819 n=1 Tax=Lytechinus pictus TaxID=7653 RepID=UPI00240D261E|nr:uncharacterized protein LOC129265819 [Lytechinus pictus]